MGCHAARFRLSAILVMALAPVIASPSAPVLADDPLAAGFAAYDAGDFVEALDRFTAVAKTGVAEAQYMVGLMHHRGRGVEVDGVTAAHWYDQAAKQNHAAALTNLGVLYRDGIGVERDLTRAADLLRRGSYLDDDFAQLAYAALMINEARNDDDFVEGAAFMRIAASRGNEIAQRNLEGLRIPDQLVEAVRAKRAGIEENIAKIVELNRRQREARQAQTPGPASNAPRPQAGAAPAARPNVTSTDEVPSRIVLVRRTLTDPQSRNMPSHTLLVPEGWQVEGGAFWAPPQMFTNLPTLDVKVTAPSGLQVHIMGASIAVDIRPAPGVGQQPPQLGQIVDGYPAIPLPRDDQEWERLITQFLMPSIREGATNIRMVRQEPEPTLTQLMKRKIAPLQQMAQQETQKNRAAGINSVQVADAAYLTFELTYDQNGRAWRELIGMAVSFSRTVFDMGFGPDDRTTWWTDQTVAFRAPQGMAIEPHLPLLVAIVNGARETPQWAQQKQELFNNLLRTRRNMHRDNMRTFAETNRILTDANREISDMIIEGGQRRDAMRERGRREFSEYVRGVETYQTTGGDTVELPAFYENTYTDGAGRYILSNDANYNPNQDPNLNGSWRTLQPAR